MTDLQPDSATAPSAPNGSNVPKPRRKFWRRKRFLIPFSFVAFFLLAVYWAYFRPIPRLRISPETTVLTAPLTADGKSVDYRREFRKRQAAWLGAPKENGFRELLAALDPRVLEQNRLAGSVRWEDFPTNDASAAWFAGYWTDICKSFEIDPNAKPPLLDRLPLDEFLRLEGIAETKTLEGAENNESEPASESFGTVWRGGEELPARLSPEAAIDRYNRLLDAPWTRTEFPDAARWLDENADLYALYERAIDAAKLGAPHFVDDKPFGFIRTLLPDVQHWRAVERDLAIRANFRVGEGDVDGALADQRLIFRTARKLLDNPNNCLIEHLVGIAVLHAGLGIDVAGNPNAFPTSEQLATAVRNLDETFGDFDVEAATQRALDFELTFLTVANAVDLFAPPTENPEELAETFDLLGGCGGVGGSGGAFAGLKRSLLNGLRRTIDPNVFLTRLNERADEARTGRFSETFFETRRSPFVALSPSRKVRSEALADAFAGLLLPACESVREAGRRTVCALRLKRLQLALFQYVAENGTLPPAFAVDANGKPLQSWRVLILPYLGDKERELYSQIRLDEPWNSERNRRFQTEAPEVFRCPPFDFGVGESESGETTTGGTTYSVVVGQNSLFDKSGVGEDLRELLKDATRDVCAQPLIVERSAPVCWTRPDAEIDEADAARFGINGTKFPNKVGDVVATGSTADVSESKDAATARGLGSRHNGGIDTATAGGGVRFVPQSLGATDGGAGARRFLFGEKLPDDKAAEPADAE